LSFNFTIKRIIHICLDRYVSAKHNFIAFA